jgi:methionyl-tRNA formyltransferase
VRRSGGSEDCGWVKVGGEVRRSGSSDEVVRILFFGTPEFAVPSLEALLAGPDLVTVVVSQPDKPRGRGLKSEATPVSACARAAGVPLFQPDRLQDGGFIASLRDLEPDLGITCAFGRILRPALLRTAPVVS